MLKDNFVICNMDVLVNSQLTQQKKTCVSSAKVANCFIFDTNNETCMQCVGYGRPYSYYKPLASSTTNSAQPIPSGGGINDYGLSFDG